MQILQSEYITRLRARINATTGLELSLKNVREIMQCIILEIRDVIANGDSVVLRGLGTFSSKQRQARQSYSIHEKTQVLIPAARRVKFKATSSLNGLLNQEEAS